MSSSAGVTIPDVRIDALRHHLLGIETVPEHLGFDRRDRLCEIAHIAAREGSRRSVADIDVSDLTSALDDEVERRITRPGRSRQQEVNAVPRFVNVELLAGGGRSPLVLFRRAAASTHESSEQATRLDRRFVVEKPDDPGRTFEHGTDVIVPHGPEVADHAHVDVLPNMRLNAYLARAGVASRRKADELIKAGRVVVNGEPGQLNTFVERGDRVEVDGEELRPQRLAYVLLHKSAGVVTTASDPQRRPTVVELVKHEVRVVPVGRLDVQTTGALLLTNDGALAHRLAHPKYEVEKVYEAVVEGEPSDESLRQLAKGVELEDGLTAPAEVRRLGPSHIELSIHEGRNRQVRRMLEAVGHPVQRLHRSRYAGLTVGDLEPGEWRELRDQEVAALSRPA